VNQRDRDRDWKETCRLFRVRCSGADHDDVDRMRGMIESGELVVTSYEAHRQLQQLYALACETLARLQKTPEPVFYAQCEKHRDVPYSITVMVGTWPRTVCPICEPPDSEYTDVRLRTAMDRARLVASPIGPMHAAWDPILDAQCLLDGRPTFIKGTREQLMRTLTIELELLVPHGN
jgi:hypothetical protein